MADKEQVRILNQGVEVWNAWRRQVRDLQIDLRGIDLSEADFIGADLRNVDLRGADFRGVRLCDADLGGADLRGAALRWADLSGADLHGADLSGAHLSGANLGRAFLWEAVLCGVVLHRANLKGADLKNANLREAQFSDTMITNANLTGCKHLDLVVHRAPSTIDIRTLQRSGPLPLAFLRGVGLPNNLIDYLPSLLGQAIQHYSCFISYSSADDDFARRLHADLQDKGVRCWFAPHDMKIGARILDTLDEAIRLREKVLLILSEASVASEWVEIEVKKALAEERQRQTTVLFPVRLDDAVFATNEAWAALLRDDRNIGDFCAWKDHDAYQRTLDRLVRDLRVEAA
jgi:uncharacterized protein YjbI with pentapeptide repeats